MPQAWGKQNIKGKVNQICSWMEKYIKALHKLIATAYILELML